MLPRRFPSISMSSKQGSSSKARPVVEGRSHDDDPAAAAIVLLAEPVSGSVPRSSSMLTSA